MKTKITLLMVAWMLAISTVFAQTQLKHWYMSGNDIEFLSLLPTNPVCSLHQTISANIGNHPLNGIYDLNGNLQFYINNFCVFNANNVNQGALTASTTLAKTAEISVVPFLSNDRCQNKYHVFFTDINTAGYIQLHHIIIDYNRGTGVFNISYGQAGEIISTLPGQGSAGIAVSTIKNNVRYLYIVSGMQSTWYGKQVRKITIDKYAPDEISISYTDMNIPDINSWQPANVFEADLSPDGSRLAWGCTFDIFAIALNSNGDYIPNSVAHIINPVSNFEESIVPMPIGIEFDKTNHNLYFSTGDIDEIYDGIYVQDLNNLSNQPIKIDYSTYSNFSQSFGASQLEMGYNGLIYACSNTYGIMGIDPLTHHFVSSSPINTIASPQLSYFGCYLFPDQIDGENYSADLFDIVSYDATTYDWSISGPITPANGQTIKIQTALNFSVPGTYTINNLTFEFGQGSILNVGNGVTLNFNNVTLQSICGKIMWQGILVHDGGHINTNSINPSPSNTSDFPNYKMHIYDAIAGITITGFNSRQFSIQNTEFERNEKNLVLIDCFNFNSMSLLGFISNNRFTQLTPLKDQTYGVTDPADGKNYGKGGIDISNTTANSSTTASISIANNYFNHGVFGVTISSTSVDVSHNTFENMNYGGVAINLNAHKLASGFWVSYNVINNTTNGIVQTNGTYEISITYNTINGNHPFSLNGISVSINPNCYIQIHNNTIRDILQNGINLYSNCAPPPIANRLEIIDNSVLNTGSFSSSTGITIKEDFAAYNRPSYNHLNVYHNTFSNMAFGVRTFGVGGNQDVHGIFPGALPHSIDNNTINFFSTFTRTGAPANSDYNSGIQLNNSGGLNIVYNTITNGLNYLWRNSGIKSENTMNSLIWKNTIQAGRGIWGHLLAYNNNYFCNTFNNNVCGMSLMDHKMRNYSSLNWKVHGDPNTRSRDNIFNGTYSNGSDIELICSDADHALSLPFPLRLRISYIWELINMRANQWLFNETPFVLYFPNPNANPYFGKPSNYNHRKYIYAGTAPNPCPSPVIWDPKDPLPLIVNVPDTILTDLFTDWRATFDNELLLKQQNQVGNLFASKLIDLQQMIESMQYSAALDLVSVMNPGHPYDYNIKTVYQTLLNARYPDIRPLTQDEIYTLSTIATQKPTSGGTGVYLARGILWCENGIDFIDPVTDKQPGIGANIVFSSCYVALPTDIIVQLVDNNHYVYSNIPVMINETGKIFITSDYVATLDTNLSYGFQINYNNTNPGLMPLEQLLQATSNNYYLCGGYGKRGNDNKKSNLPNSIKQQTIQLLNIYPNPANSNIKIDLPDNMLYNIEAFDMRGQKVFSQKSIESITINTINFENGIYFIKISDPEGNIVKLDRISIIK